MGPDHIPIYLTSVFDAPVFIDSYKIELLYDAIIRSVDEEPELGRYLSGSQSDGGEFDELNYHVIDDEDGFPQRKLRQLLMFYHERHPNQVITFKNKSDTDLFEQIDPSNPVPQLVFLDLPGKDEKFRSGDTVDTVFIPSAAEFESNHVEVMADQFYQGDTWVLAGEETNINYVNAVLEEQVREEGNIYWIDYRLPVNCDHIEFNNEDLGDEPSVHGRDSIHLHFAPKGKYDVSTFAYNLVKQSWKNGVRVLGTLNRGPYVHVLSYYGK